MSWELDFFGFAHIALDEVSRLVYRTGELIQRATNYFFLKVGGYEINRLALNFTKSLIRSCTLKIEGKKEGSQSNIKINILINQLLIIVMWVRPEHQIKECPANAGHFLWYEPSLPQLRRSSNFVSICLTRHSLFNDFACKRWREKFNKGVYKRPQISPLFNAKVSYVIAE